MTIFFLFRLSSREFLVFAPCRIFIGLPTKGVTHSFLHFSFFILHFSFQKLPVLFSFARAKEKEPKKKTRRLHILR
ncbi:MAG: hypothetical protein IKN48_02615 [Bacteroidaceae bacterium]|nr:hypothetical protein [Bacteroidaceae bacterium]